MKKRKAHLSFEDNIWGADLVDMELKSKINKEFWFLWYVIDIYSKYGWVVPLKNKKSSTITNGFQIIIDKFERNPNKIWVDKGSVFLT